MLEDGRREPRNGDADVQIISLSLEILYASQVMVVLELFAL